MKDEKKLLEEVTLVDEEAYLHLKETVTETGIAYEAFDRKTGAAMGAGLITWEDMLDHPIRNPLACARRLAMDEIGLRGEVVSRVALRTLEKVKEARRSYLRAHRDDAPDHSIRFITSSYDELFRIPNGGTVKVQYPDRSFIARCEYIDDYHTRIGNEVFHICQFAEILERGGATVQPEPELFQQEAAWQISQKDYLSVHEADEGWDYSIYDKDFNLIDGGYLTDPRLTILEVRNSILKAMKMERRNLTQADYDEVAEKAEDAEERKLQDYLFDAEVDALAEKLDDFGYDFDPYGYGDAFDSREAGFAAARDSILSDSLDSVREYLSGIVEDDLDEEGAAAALIGEINAFTEKHPDLGKEKTESVLDQLRDKQKASEATGHHAPVKPPKEECL